MNFGSIDSATKHSKRRDYTVQFCFEDIVAEAYTTQPNSKASSRVLYIYLACMAG